MVSFWDDRTAGALHRSSCLSSGDIVHHDMPGADQMRGLGHERHKQTLNMRFERFPRSVGGLLGLPQGNDQHVPSSQIHDDVAAIARLGSWID